MTIEDGLTGRVGALFPKALQLPIPDDGVDLIETGVLDSLALIELLTALEQEFEIRFDLADLDPEQFRSVDAIAGLVFATATENGTPL